MTRKQRTAFNFPVETTRLREAVKSAYPIDQALRDLTQVNLLGRGPVLKGLCPFHVERTPSFQVDRGKGKYTCFGAGCEATGDVFTLFQDVCGMSYPEALVAAADRVGVPVPDEIRRWSERRAGGMAGASRPVREVVFRPRVAPAGARPAPFIVIPQDIPLPRPGARFRVWDDEIRNDKPPHLRNIQPEMVHVYRDSAGRALHLQLRVRKRDGGKFFLPVRLGQPKTAQAQAFRLDHPDLPEGTTWLVLGPDQDMLKPIYGMEDLPRWIAQGPRLRLLIVEGEKTRDATARLLRDLPEASGTLVLSLMGNGSAAYLADWSPLLDALAARPDSELELVAWPDADEVIQMRDGRAVDRRAKFIASIHASFRAALTSRKDQSLSLILSGVRLPEGKTGGWDLADAESEGWSGQDVLSHIAQSRIISEEVSMPMISAPANEDPDFLADEAGFGVDPLLQSQFDDLDDIDLAEDGAGSAPDATGAESLPAAGDGDTDPPDDFAYNPVENNEYFECLGHLDGVNYFLSLRGGNVYGLTPQQMRPNYFLHLAPKQWWIDHFMAGQTARQAVSDGWENATDALISATFAAGAWKPERAMGTGARMDGGLVVYNLGDRLYVEDRGVMRYAEFQGEHHYVTSKVCRMPDFNTPFPANSPEIREFIDIVGRLNWREAERNLSVMALVGWIAISPICGLLKWRPHLWLDGPLGSGKSWIIENLISRVLGDYCYVVKGNSTESGIRNLLDRKALPLIFDEAEGEERDERRRMDQILKMARHSASEGKSYVVKGVSGGGGEKINRVEATFLLCSITPQLEAAADISRFARAHLNGRASTRVFEREIEQPAADLLTPEFSNRFLGRMIMRGSQYEPTYRCMVKTFTEMGLNRRSADVYGALATGAWLLLRDGIPQTVSEVAAFLGETFDVLPAIKSAVAAIRDERDHVRLFAALMQSTHRFDSRQTGARSETIGDLVKVACNLHDENDTVISAAEARRVLQPLGIRPGLGGSIVRRDNEVATTLLIHKKSHAIAKFLQDTPYARSYADVISQAEGVFSGEPALFMSGTPVARPLVVPIGHFFSENRETDE